MSNDPLIHFIGLSALILMLCARALKGILPRSSHHLAYVRGGRGAEKVIHNRGDFVFPFLHQVTEVSLLTNAIPVLRENHQAILSKDHLRANLHTVFYLKVNPRDSDILSAAQKLGHRTMNPDQLQEFLIPLLNSLINRTSSEFTLVELQSRQAEFSSRLQGLSADILSHFGLCLEKVCIVFCRETGKNYYDADKLLDAIGLSKITEVVEAEKRKRNELEQSTRIAMRRKQSEADQIIHHLNQENRKRIWLEEQEVITRNSALQIEKNNAESHVEYEKTQTKILADQKLKIAEHNREIAIAEQATERAWVFVEANLAKAKIVLAEEEIVSERELARAERMHQIHLLQAKNEAQRETLLIKEKAIAEKIAAEERAEAERIGAQGKVEALEILHQKLNELSALKRESAAWPASGETDTAGTNACAQIAFPNESSLPDLRTAILELFSNVLLELKQAFENAPDSVSASEQYPFAKTDQAKSPERMNAADPEASTSSRVSKVLETVDE